jgi:hypothetical protein
MSRTTVRIAIAAALIGLRWVAGRAQIPQPDFELAVDAPVGGVNVTCVKGCALAWVERGVNPNSQPMRTFTFSCGGPAVRCPSGKIGGWITQR